MEYFQSTIHKVIKVASRSMNDEIPSRMGVDDFLEICLSKVEINADRTFSSDIKREFQKFKYENRA